MAIEWLVTFTDKTWDKGTVSLSQVFLLTMKRVSDNLYIGFRGIVLLSIGGVL